MPGRLGADAPARRARLAISSTIFWSIPSALSLATCRSGIGPVAGGAAALATPAPHVTAMTAAAHRWFRMRRLLPRVGPHATLRPVLVSRLDDAGERARRDS
jgi:hypothetical protein